MQIGFKRGVLLFLLVVVLFVNWYYSYYLPFYIQEVLERVFSHAGSDSFMLKSLSKFNMLYKWISIAVLMVINIAISLTIIYTYFLDKKILWQAVRVLGIYAGVFFVAYYRLQIVVL